MSDTRDLIEELETALSTQLGIDTLIENESPTPHKDVRTKFGRGQRSHFIDFGMGGSGRDTGYATAPDGPLRTKAGEAYGFFKVRALDDGTLRLEVHTMAADWHRGKDVDPQNVAARIRLGQQLAGASMPGWTAAEDWRIEKHAFRSAMVWMHTLSAPHSDARALADEIITAVEAARPSLSAAVGA